MSSVNKVILLGRLGRDPEMRHTPSGTAVCNISLATSTEFNRDRGPSGMPPMTPPTNEDMANKRNEVTEWHRVVVWGKLAENCAQYLTKGRLIYLEGRLQTRSWDDKQGAKHYTTEIVANTIQFIASNGSSNGNYENREPQQGANDYSSSTPSGSMGTESRSSSGFVMPSDAHFTADDIPF